ncbi:hypothetical protein KC317_g63 [Hortaea werneckii]|nr:hypothetical protein KC317_g63 [Hortaea werneckii]KAI7628676.1 hypothetical protein KC346_g67 [Hortaea werneckii]
MNTASAGRDGTSSSHSDRERSRNKQNAVEDTAKADINICHPFNRLLGQDQVPRPSLDLPFPPVSAFLPPRLGLCFPSRQLSLRNTPTPVQHPIIE